MKELKFKYSLNIALNVRDAGQALLPVERLEVADLGVDRRR